MELYFFNQEHGYGQQYIVMSDSKESALIEVKKYLLEQTKGEDGDLYMQQYKDWESATIDNLPQGYSSDGYSIEIYQKNQVLETYYG